MSRTTKILLVEDDRHTRKSIERILAHDVKLRYLNIEVIPATDGEEGQELFDEHDPDLVVTDLLLPRGNGFELIDSIRQDPLRGDCPILVITGVYRDRKMLKELGSKNVQVQFKPFMPQALTNTVHQMLIRQRPAETKAPQRAARLTPQPKISLAEKMRGTREAQNLSDMVPAVIDGDLAEMSLPQLLFGALEEQLSGNLDVRHGKVRKVIHLVAGHPIFVQSNLRGETLGQMLVKRGKITQDQHSLALAESKKQGIKYGGALVHLGFLTDGEVMEELLEQTRLKLTGCLRWTEGKWTFQENPDEQSVPRCVVDPVQLIFESLHRRGDMEEAFARLADKTSHRLQLTSRFNLYRDRFNEVFGPTVVDVVTTDCTVHDVIRGAGSPQEAVLQIDVLLQTGLAELEEPEPDDLGDAMADEPVVPELDAAVPLERLAMEPESALEEQQQAPADWEESSAVVWVSPELRARLAQGQEHKTSEVRVALQLIQSTYLILHQQNYYEILGVTSQSDNDNIEVAYQVKRRQFELDNFRDLDLGDHYAHLEEIGSTLDQAFEVLSDPDQRAAYDRSLGHDESDKERNQALAAEMHCRRGEEQFNRKRFDKALDAFRQAVEVDAQAEYQSKYALAHFMVHRDREGEAAGEAMLMVQEALATDPEDQTAHLVAATISRAVGHGQEALHHLQQLIKINPCSREAFDEAESLLLDEGDVEAVELLYRRTLHLLGDRDREWTGLLWSRLMVIYRDRLADPDRARTAGEVALRYRPDDAEVRAAVAAIDHGQPDRWPQAVLGYRSLLRSDADATAPLHQLFKLHCDGARLDAALTAASVAELRGVANDEEKQFFERYRPRYLRRAHRPLEPPLLESLRHPHDDPGLATLFRILTPLVQRRHPLKISDLDLGSKDLIPPEQLPEGFASVMRYVCEQLSVTFPHVALNPGLGVEVQSAGTDPPVLIAGPEALESDERFELCFRVTQALNLLSPGRRLASWWPRRTLRDYVLASLSVAFPRVDVPDKSGAVAIIREELEQAGELKAAVKGAVTALRQHSGLNLADWQRGINRTADRVGLLLCTDLVTAWELKAAQDEEAAGDLLDFALSETYGELRQSLGLALT